MLPPSISYDYTDLIADLKQDIEEGIDNPLFVFRKKEPLPSTDHCPILDYASKTYPLNTFINECEKSVDITYYPAILRDFFIFF